MSAPAAAQDPSRLAVSGLTVTYHNGHTALRDAGFTLEGGTLCALLMRRAIFEAKTCDK